jgi:hypothetical protein
MLQRLRAHQRAPRCAPRVRAHATRAPPRRAHDVVAARGAKRSVYAHVAAARAFTPRRASFSFAYLIIFRSAGARSAQRAVADYSCPPFHATPPAFAFIDAVSPPLLRRRFFAFDYYDFHAAAIITAAISPLFSIIDLFHAAAAIFAMPAMPLHSPPFCCRHSLRR